MSAIFISYRREDSEGHAGRLFEDLVEHFGHDSVFMDVAGIEPGRDFRKVIDAKVAGCGLLLAVIGTRWLEARDDSGKRRIDDPSDFVRLETVSALRRDIPVVPVLVHGAQMPRADQLPADLADLAYRNAVELTHARWESDVKVLVDSLAQLLRPAPATSSAAGAPSAAPPAAPSAAPPSPASPALPGKPATRRKALIGVAAVAVLGLAAVLVWLPQDEAITGETADAAAPPPAPVAGDADTDDERIALLLSAMNDPDMATRKSATARLLREYADSRGAVTLAVELLSEANFQRLQREGRVNLLTYLVGTQPAAWPEAERQVARSAIERIRARVASGTATTGPQVTDLLQKLDDKLSG